MAEPSTVAASRKVTTPEGMPAPGATAETVAARATGWPATDGLGDDVIVVVVPAATTRWVSSGDDEAVSPLVEL